jgi:hypothetical protein
MTDLESKDLLLKALSRFCVPPQHLQVSRQIGTKIVQISLRFTKMHV